MEKGTQAPDCFEAVYYSYAVPRTAEALTMLGLVFDRIYFPGVYMPPQGFDEEAVRREIQRISPRLRDANELQLLACMAYSLEQKHLTDLCVFTGRNGGGTIIPNEAHDIVDRLEDMIFGPRPAGHTPIRSGPWVKGFPGDDPLTYQVSAPDTITYPANALVFAAKNGLPLINDQESLPVPGLATDAKSNAKLLATVLAIESVRLVLPTVRTLEPAALKEFREEIAPDVKQFRLAMLRLAKELNAAISAAMPITAVQKEARFLAETKIYPELANLESILQNPKKHWYRRAADFAKSAPELVSNFLTMPLSTALAKLLVEVVGLLRDYRDEQLAGQEQIAASGLNYLLKLKKQGE